MQKYSFKTKLEIVKIYNRGEAGMKHLAKLYGTNKVSVKTWIHAYNNLGIKGLRPLKKSPTYSFEFKKNIVKLYLKGNISYMDLVDRFKLKDPSTIKGWVQTYKKKGVKGLIPRKGALFIMPKKVKNAKRNLEKIPKTMEEALKLLKEQKHLLELKEIEIEFIKKKNALIAQKELQTKKLQE